MDERPTGGPPPEDPGRRRFLELVVGIFTSLVAAALATPFLGSIVGSSSRAGRRSFSKVATVDSLPLGRPIDVAYSEMAPDAFIRQEAVRHLWVIRRSESEVVVYSPICPHLGCHYDWDARAGLFKCPCHASVFAEDGRVLSGPSPRPLDTLPAEVRNGVLYVEWERYKTGTARKVAV
jgi:menaquinol-cytochrome c reductase iron-sulfur subunit